MSSNSASESKKVTNLIEIGNKLAVLVGINEYADSSINRLNFSVKDIQDFYGVLIDSEKGKYEDKNIKVLCDTNAEKPTRNNILSKLTTVSRSANPEDSILFYFSGHGAEIEGKPYLLCSDSYRNTIEQTALQNELIRKTMESSLARVKTIVIDACHSGVLKGIKASGIMTKSFFESFFPPPEGFVVLSSCKLGECSHEWAEKEHGVFSYFLLEGLRGGADRDKDGIITITDAYTYTSENVRRWAFQKGLEQNPILDAKISGDIPLVFVERRLEKEKLIDKSIISKIFLKSRLSEVSPRALAEGMCGHLLQFFEADEIGIKGEKYEFPCGVISPRWGGEEHWVEISFEYEKDKWGRIDEIIKYLDPIYYFQSIEFKLVKRINVVKLVKKCKENAFGVISFRPVKEKESITVDTDGWLSTRTVFSNQEGSSNILILSKGYYFPSGFYSTLSPENIVEFIKTCTE